MYKSYIHPPWKEISNTQGQQTDIITKLPDREQSWEGICEDVRKYRKFIHLQPRQPYFTQTVWMLTNSLIP